MVTTAKQTATRLYQLEEWPATHIRTRVACDCRGYACEILRDVHGMSYPAIARALGFRDHTSVMYAITRYKAGKLKKMGHMTALLSCFNQLQPI